MAVTTLTGAGKLIRFIGLSTDTKPTIASHAGLPAPSTGSTFLAYDTQTMYITYDGTNWALKDQMGEVQATPTSNTLLGRLKDLLTGTILAAGSAIIGRVGHDVTGIGHGVTTVTTAGTDVVLAASTACKMVIIQAQTDNTNAIAVGATGVDATIATGTGIILYAGETIVLPVDNLADVFIDSLVNGEGVRYTYLT